MVAIEDALGTSEQLRDSGNQAVRNGEWQTAVDRYTEALQKTQDEKEKATIYRNRALVRIKLDDFQGAEDDASKAIEVNGADSKALYRRALAREELDNIAGAFADAKAAHRLEKGDRTIETLLQRLVVKNNEKVKKATSMETRVSDMSRLAFAGEAKDQEQRQTAMKNILVLARDSESGAQRVWSNGQIVPMLLSMLDKKEPLEISLTAVRILDEVIKNHNRAMVFIAMHDKVEMKSVNAVIRLMCKRDEPEFVDASGILTQRLFNAAAKMDRQKSMKPDPEVAERNKEWIIRLIVEIQSLLKDATVSAKVRETGIDLLLKNLMHMDGGIPRGWSWRFVEGTGVQFVRENLFLGLTDLLDVATQSPEQCDYPVSHETRQHMAICLARLYDDMVFDTRRGNFKAKLDEFYNYIMAKINEPRYKIKLANLLITLLQAWGRAWFTNQIFQGPVDVGISLVTNDQVTAVMMQMAASDDHIHQSIAAELIVMTVSKHERATTIIKVGLPILRKLFESDDEEVKVRALVGLCKCASAGGDDASRMTMVEGSTLKLAKTCKKFLLDVNKYSVNVRRFACEGLSYLTLDADVKEWIVEDPLLLQALLCLARSAGALCVYTLASIYVNLTNSYDKPKADEEMVKLAQFAKHHVPETHPKDTDDCVDRRVKLLVEEGAVAACVAVGKTESKNAMDQLARCMLAFSDQEPLRGRIISEGGAKLLLTLCKKANPEGQIKAAHALAKLGSKADPTLVFPGQRGYEVVKPLVELLHPDIEGKPNYDALLTLTNLASLGESYCRRIIKEKAVPKTEEYWFMTDHQHLRAAAAELLLNLLHYEEFLQDTIRKGTDRIKLWVLYCAEESDDDRLALASSAGFVLISETGVEANRRIIDEIKSWPELFKDICMSENPEVQMRCLMAIANMMECDEKICAEIIASDVFRVLVAITKLGKNQMRAKSVEQAKRALAAAEKFGLIAPTDRELYERKTGNLTTISE